MNSVYLNRLRPREERLSDSLGKSVSPGMYLMLLRNHLNQGKSVLNHLVDSVSEGIPASEKWSESSQNQG